MQNVTVGWRGQGFDHEKRRCACFNRWNGRDHDTERIRICSGPPSPADISRHQGRTGTAQPKHPIGRSLMRYAADTHVALPTCPRVGSRPGYEKLYLNAETKRSGHPFNNRPNYGSKRGASGVDGGCLMTEGGMLGGHTLGLV